MAIQRVDFQRWYRYWFRVWRQGQHVTVIGPTQIGKTTLTTNLVERRGLVVAFATKPADDSLNRLKRRGYHAIDRWERPNAREGRVLFWPRKGIKHPLDTFGYQVTEFDKGLVWLYRTGHYCVWFDELRYMADQLKMTKWLQLMYTQSASLKISLVGLTQRPAWVPPEAYSQVGHMILFQTGDERDLVRLSLNGVSGRKAAEILLTLGEREFLHVDTRAKTMVISEMTLADVKQLEHRPIAERKP